MIEMMSEKAYFRIGKLKVHRRMKQTQSYFKKWILISKWLRLIKELENLGRHIIEESGSTKRPSDPETVAKLLLIRTVSHVAAIRSLIKKRMVVEARTLTRSCVENFLWIGSLAENGEQTVAIMRDNDLKYRKLFGERLLQSVTNEQKKQMVNLRQMLKDIKEDWPDVRTVTPKEIAEKGVIKETYIFYSELSMDSAHPTTDSLSRHLSDTSFCFEPKLRPSETENTLWYIAITLLGACVGVNQIVGGTQAGKKLTEMEARYQRIYQQHTTQKNFLPSKAI